MWCHGGNPKNTTRTNRSPVPKVSFPGGSEYHHPETPGLQFQSWCALLPCSNTSFGEGQMVRLYSALFSSNFETEQSFFFQLHFSINGTKYSGKKAFSPLEKHKQRVSEKGHKNKIQIKRHKCINQLNKKYDIQTQHIFTWNKQLLNRPRPLLDYCI